MEKNEWEKIFPLQKAAEKVLDCCTSLEQDSHLNEKKILVLPIKHKNIRKPPSAMDQLNNGMPLNLQKKIALNAFYK